MSKIHLNFEQTLIPSTKLIENIKLNALELSKQIGQGFTLKVDVINNKERQNCNIYIEKLKVD